MRRSAALMVALVLVLAACGDDETKEATAGPVAEEATTNTATKTVPTTVALATTGPSTSVASESVVGATATDPWGLSEIKDPTTQEEVNVIFLAMPNDIDGMVASQRDPVHTGIVDYEGNGSHASIAWLEAGRDATAAIQDFDEISIVLGDLDSGDTFVWTSADEIDEMFMAWWGDPTDGSLFSVVADTPEHRDAVINTFIAGAST